MEKNLLLAAIMGVAVGDALGLPVQFYSRERCQRMHVTQMLDWEFPNGTYSDDTAMTLCTLASLKENDWQLDEKDIMERFVAWIGYGYMTCDDMAIDVGMATRKAIQRYYDGVPLDECGCRGFRECGNGSLMRIMPLVFYLAHSKKDELYDAVRKVSSLTHAHEVCVLGCYIYVALSLELLEYRTSHEELVLNETDKLALFGRELEIIHHNVKGLFSADAVKYYERIFNLDSFRNLPMEAISSSGFVVHSLEAALWCFVTTGNFRDCLIKAVSLGDDTDSVAAIAGGIAAMFYGYDAIPAEWIKDLRNKNVIYELCD